MRRPSIPADEAERLRALSEYGLDARNGLPALDPVVDLAARMFNCPVAAVNMIGDDHVFIISETGLGDYNPSRDVSFCAHAINQEEVMVVEDAALDQRFHDNPLVTAGAIRFYAGAPLRCPAGHALGALCVIDNKPHAQFTIQDRTHLRELAKLASDRLELRRLEFAGVVGAAGLAASAATSPNAVICFDASERITAWNGAASVMFGRSAEAAIGQSIGVLVAESDRETVHAGIARVLEGGTPKSAAKELICLRRNGERFPTEIHWSRWCGDNQIHFGAIIQDMTEKRREHDALHRLANYDTLTELPNSNLFHDYVSAALTNGAAVSLIVTDLEGFSDINNTLGHAAGDQVLRLVARRLRAVLPRGSFFARLSGDEFATVLVGEGDPIRVGDVVRLINAAVAEPMLVDGQEIRIESHCGMAIGPDHGRVVEELLGSAQLALFQARNGGGGGSCLFTPALRAEAMARRLQEAELHRALERREFVLFYQPQFRITDNALVGAEALIRWRHPVRGLLAPAAFLSAVEAGGLAEPVGRWVLETGCAQAAAWRETHPDFWVSVNLFAAQFRTENLPELVRKTLAIHKAPASALELEITENIILDQQDRILKQLKELRQIGVMLSFDDFGTGYASLNLLRIFPITHIKIDKSFVQAMRFSPKDQAIVVSVIDLARKLGLKVVAEGIETREDWDFLRTRACERGQGYFLGKPVPPALFAEQFLTDGAAARSA